MGSFSKLATKEPQVVEGYNNGMTLRQLSDFHNVSAGTIRNVLIRQGVRLRSRGRRRESDKSQPVVEQNA